MIQESCPHCSKLIEVEVYYYDDEPDVRLTRAVTWEPCLDALTACVSDRRRGTPCNRLGPWCNVASHVTPCSVWTAPARSPVAAGLRVRRHCVGVGTACAK